MTAFLADPSLTPLWGAVRAALDRNGLDWRGRLTLPDLPPEGRRRLGVLIDRPIPAGRRSVLLGDLATGVERVAGRDLFGVLRDLGHGPAGRREALAARRDETRGRWEALDLAVRRFLPDADWVGGWRDAVWRDGRLAHRSPEEIGVQVESVGRVLDATPGRSRVELAAHLFGSAHELDATSRLGPLVTRALVARDGPADDERTVWERAGIPLDLVSAPVLTWGLAPVGDSAVAAACHAMTAAGLPLHLTVLALRAAPLAVLPGTAVLIVENPRLVEAAAGRALPVAVLCTHGNPTTAPVTAITGLRECGADLRYHGDFDSPGLAMTARAEKLGCRPFRMGAADYLAAVGDASAAGVDLPVEEAEPPATPWCPTLREVFDEHRAVVHEERVMDAVLDAHAAD